MVTFMCLLIIQLNFIDCQPVPGDKINRNNLNKRLASRKSTKSPTNNDYMPMASMQMINRNAMMHNKLSNKQQLTTKATKILTTTTTTTTTVNPLCVTQVSPTETTKKSVRPNTIFTSYNWLPSRWIGIYGMYLIFKTLLCTKKNAKIKVYCDNIKDHWFI